MNKALNIAIILTAYDKATRVINDAMAKSEQKMKDMKKASMNAFGQGAAYTGVGVAIGMSMKPAIDAYRQLEDAQSTLKSSMMMSNGTLPAEFAKIDKLAQNLGNRLPGTTADFYLMFETMINQGIPALTILDGVGESAAYLSVALKMPYDEAGKLAAKLKEATGTANQDMMAFMDTIARTKNMGVATDEMQYAFGRSAGGLKLMGIQGLEASKQLAGVYAMLIRTGMSGETVGTGFQTVLNAMLNPAKMGAAQAAAGRFGISLQFMKDGKFAGIENMMAQLDKLKALGAEDRAGIVNALTGGGQDASMLQTLITNGVSGYQKIQAGMQKQANLNQKVTSQLGTLSNTWEATTGTITNMLARIGQAIGPELKMISTWMGKAAAAFGSFMDNNPRFAKFLALLVSGTAILLTIVGIVKMVRGVMIALNLVMMMNPIVLIFMAIMAVGMLIYAYWDKIVAFFKRVWEAIKSVFSKAWQYIKNILVIMNPMLLIIKYWEPIKKFFSNLWEDIKSIFSRAWKWFVDLHVKFYNAGKNIVLAIWEGIKSLAMKPVEAIQSIVKKMREYLPFSPAKRGPLMDIHRIKLVETIAASIKPGPMMDAMGRLATATFNAGGRGMRAQAIPSGGGGSMIFNYAPVINGSTPGLAGILRDDRAAFEKQMDAYMAKRERTRF